jgi:hypothetical protein
VKALTVCQPYADMILSLNPDGSMVKPVENRVWWTPYRGELLIHAGKSLSWLDGADPSKFTFGAILGKVELYAMCEVGELPVALRGHVHANGPVCWLLRNPVRFATPFPCAGRQKLWDIAFDFNPEAA